MPSLDPSTVLNASVPASAMPLISPDALLHAHLKQSPPRRPSNRLTSEPRPIQLNVGSLTHCNGSSLVKIGATTIVCGVRAEILPTSEIPSFRVTKSADKDWTLPSRPKNEVDDHEGEGEYSATQLYNLVVPNIELATGCSPRHPANTAPSLKAYWTLYIDMMCISHGGSVFDAAWLALDAALRNCLLPKAWWDADLEKVICSMDVKEARKLRLRGMPVPSSWGLFVPEKRLLTMQNDGEDRSWILMDLDTFEEESCAEVGCITVDCSNGADSAVVLRIEKSGGSVVGVDQIAQVAESAKQRWQQWKNVLDTALTA
ncbi:3' exoribonuclease family, domain-containing protein isoform 2 [Cladophialophora immunda]|nr:3' exoribonuclease family, domain-containing protein isoform 2 [Cladophialophora immunda]